MQWFSTRHAVGDWEDLREEHFNGFWVQGGVEGVGGEQEGKSACGFVMGRLMGGIDEVLKLEEE